MITRNNCVICNTKLGNPDCIIPDMPINVCSYNDPISPLRYDLEYVSCKNCGTVQLKRLADINKVYDVNHNLGTMGETWKTHEKEFGNFIPTSKHISTCLEIGSSTGNLFKSRYIDTNQSEDIPKWDIVDIDPQPKFSHPKLNFIKGEFPNVDIKNEYDIVVMSHVLEHMQEPDKCIKKIRDICHGLVFLSFPLFPNDSIFYNINFEHTYGATPDQIEKLFKQNGYIKHYCRKFRKHSTFFLFKPDYMQMGISHNKSIDIKKHFSDITNLVKTINEAISATPDIPIYFFGAHYPIQYLQSLGLNKERITGILDNDPVKIGRYLHGQKIKTEHPEVLKDVKNALVIVLLGVYTNEIKEQIHNINPNVRIIM